MAQRAVWEGTKKRYASMAVLRGSCMVRSQPLEIWFGQLGPISGLEGDDGTRVFRRNFGRFLKVD